MWFRCSVFCLILWSLIDPVVNDPKCPVSKDLVFNGLYMNCRKQNLTWQDLKGLYIDNITTLDLSENHLKYLPNNSLVGFSELKCLICMRCRLQNLDIDSLNGLRKLRVLHLNLNSLRIKDAAFPNGTFKHVPLLNELYIDDNNNEGTIDMYSHHIDIFKSLPQLTDLAIDSFESLNIHEEFLQFSNLQSLQIDCSKLREIYNESFKGFENSIIKKLELSGGHIYEPQLGLDVFQYLPNISYLSLNRLRIGNNNFLLMMKPLEGRNIETIRVSTLYSAALSTLSVKFSDAFVTVQSMKYLSNICVTNFYWFDSHLYSVDGEAFLSHTWTRCLEAILLQSDQMIDTDVINFFRLVWLKKIKLLAFSLVSDGLLNQFFTSGPGIEYTNKQRNRFVKSSDSKTHFLTQSRDAENEHAVRVRQTGLNPRAKTKLYVPDENSQVKSKQFLGASRKENTLPRQPANTLNSQPILNSFMKNKTVLSKLAEAKEIMPAQVENVYNNHSKTGLGKLVIAIPSTLKTLFIDGLHLVTVKTSYWFTENNSLSTLVGSNGVYTTVLYGYLHGLNQLSTINLQNTKILLKLDFFETFPNLRTLNLRKTTLSSDFYERNIKKIVENIQNLEDLDIAENDLTILAPHTFHTSKKLKYLSLEKNRFFGIPFDLRHTPELELLDLRGNVFSELSREDRAAIDEHIKRVPNFTILLSDNILSCSCSVFPFIAWLRENQAHFERDGNFTCLSEDGKLIYTAFHADIAGFWRQCSGQYYFLVSLIMLCALLAGYCALFLGMKRKTQIISFFMRVFVPGFHLKSRKDFSTDVFIGYADQDVDYVRNVLLGRLEEEWHLRTFVHSRDLLTDPLMMTAALEDSWRCLILITDNFLSNYHYSYNIMKVASFFVGPNNPKRVVLMVEERVQHRLPAYLLQVVDEDNILILPHLEGCLDTQAVDTLRARLLD